MTRNEAIKRSIELWKWCAETGNDKREWPGFKHFKTLPIGHCFLCEYANSRQKKSVTKYKERRYCSFCPYSKKFGDCILPHNPYSHYYYHNHNGMPPDSWKKYAAEFVKQLESLLEENKRKKGD